MASKAAIARAAWWHIDWPMYLPQYTTILTFKGARMRGQALMPCSCYALANNMRLMPMQKNLEMRLHI